MATATINTTTSEVRGFMTNNNRARLTLDDRPDLQEIVKDILALKSLAKSSLFLTHKTQREILNRLKPQELAIVARAVSEAEKQNQ
jgi:hypothetical protein